MNSPKPDMASPPKKPQTFYFRKPDALLDALARSDERNMAEFSKSLKPAKNVPSCLFL
jgi:hypothetical protein